MVKKDKIKQALKNLSPEDKIELHNLRSSEEKRGEDNIYPNDEDFFNTFYSNDVFGAVQRAVYGDYNPHHDYVTFDGYANLKSFETFDLDKYISDDEIAEFLNENEQYIEDYLEIEESEKNEVSEEEYYDSLEVLPPFYFKTLNGKKVSGGFAVSEATAHRDTPDGFKATYSGYYKSGDKYFGVGEVYFVETDTDGEPTGYSDDGRNAKTLNPDAFAKGGGVRRPLFSNREYSYGRNWTNDHRHENKSEDYEVPQGSRKRKYGTGGGTEFTPVGTMSLVEYLKKRLQFIQDDAERIFMYAPKELLDHPVKDWESIGTLLSNIQIASNLSDKESDNWYAKGGGVRKTNGREYSFGRAWTNDHRHENRKENWEVPQADRVRKFATGGGIELTEKQKQIDMNDNGRIDSEDFAILRKSMNGAWRNDHKHVNHSEGYEKSYARRKNPTRTGYKGKKEYGTGGKSEIPHYKVDGEIFVDYDDAMAYCDKKNMSYDKIVKTKEYKTGGLTPKEPIAFKTSNLYFNSFGRDINGNSVIRLSFPNTRAFSIQLNNGSFEKTYKPFGQSGFDDVNEMEINSYIKEFGSPAQKKKLKIYK